MSLKTIRSRSRVLVSLFLLFFSNRFLFFVLVYVWLVTFDFTTPPTKRRRLFSQKSLHIISHLHLIITEISNAHEKSFLTFQREREFRCAEQQQQQQQQRLLFSSSLFFLKIVLSRARARIIYARRAHFNHPSHGAALSHVETTMIAARRTRARRLFRAKEEETKTEESPKKTQ